MTSQQVFRKCSACSVTTKATEANKRVGVLCVPLVPWKRARARVCEQIHAANIPPISRVHFFAEHTEQEEHPRRHWCSAIFTKRNKRNTYGTPTMTPKTKPLRETMPLTAAWIDELRAGFGTESINNSIRMGMQGFPDWFHATEGEHEVGTPFKPIDPARCVSLADMVIRSKVEPDVKRRIK